MIVKVTSVSFSKDPELRQELLRHFPQASFNTDSRIRGTRDLVGFLRGAEGVIVGLDRIDEEVLRECPELRFIAKYGVGLDNIDLDACGKRGVAIGWSGGVNRLSVAEMTLGFMLGLFRNLFRSSAALKRGEWAKEGGAQLSGKTVGVIGVGNIGKEVIRLLHPFRCRILVNDILDQREYYRERGLLEAEKGEIFAGADVVTIHTPFTPLTDGMVHGGVLATMKRSAFLINTARGGIVREGDLKRALQEGTIAGAAVDVYDLEPPLDREFLGLPGLICTPHIGGNAREAVTAMGMSAIQHLRGHFGK